MRIGITMLSDDETWGGIGVYTREIVSRLLALDRANEYVLIYPRFGAACKHLGRYQRVHENCREVLTGRSLPWTAFWEQTAAAQVARKERLDLLFNPFWSVPVFGKYKKVLIVHGVDSHVVPKSLKWRGRFEWALHSKLWVHQADAVISISDLMTRDLERFTGLPHNKIRRIYHGRSEIFQQIAPSPALEAARRRYQLPEKYLLFVGMLFPQKNFSNLVRAFSKVAAEEPHDLVVVGRPRWNYQRELQVIQDLGLERRVRFLNHVPNHDLPALYNLADCFVFPSFYEAFGLVGVEAIACGCPVAAARAGALPEVLADAAVYYDPNDVDEMAACILKLIQDREARAQLIERGLKRAKMFTWERAARNVLQLFEDVVAGRPV